MKLTPHLNVILASAWTLSSRCGEWASAAESAFLEKSAPLLLFYQLACEDDLNSFQKRWEKKETWTHCCNYHPQTGRAAYLETHPVPLSTSTLSSRHSGYAGESNFLSTLNEVSHHGWIEDTEKWAKSIRPNSKRFICPWRALEKENWPAIKLNLKHTNTHLCGDLTWTLTRF